MVTRLVWLGAGLLALGIAGCGDDTGGSSTGTGGSGNAGSGGDGGTGNSGTGNSGTGNSGTGNSGTGNSGTGGTGAAGGSGGSGGSSGNPDAATFCAEFDNVCGYGNGFDNVGECTAAYDALTEARKSCVNEHLGNAVGGGPNQDTHCPHATGLGPCS